MSVSELFYSWRKIKRPEQSWGLAWYLAYEFCRRFYSSHGIAPYVIEKEGLGYYGIQLSPIKCKINQKPFEPYGRLTMSGNVENWRRGSPGDHGLPIQEMLCSDGNVSVDEIVRKAIEHMDIEPIPKVSHLNCRHKRWGASYELCFEIATILALRHEPEDLTIWNHPYHTERILAELDPKAGMKEHLGAFVFKRYEKQIVLAADGRLLDHSGKNLWMQFMRGDNVLRLAGEIEDAL